MAADRARSSTSLSLIPRAFGTWQGRTIPKIRFYSTIKEIEARLADPEVVPELLHHLKHALPASRLVGQGYVQGRA